MKHIMERHDNELLKKVFLAQKLNPSQGDFVNIVEKDLKHFNLTHKEVTEMSKTQLKATLKKNSQSAAFEQLKTTLLTHTKVKNIKYHHLEMQMYLKSDDLSCEEIKTLTSFRSNCTRNIRSNFKRCWGPDLSPNLVAAVVP